MRALAIGGLALASLASATPAWADWQEAQTAHFIIYSDDSPERLERFATRLEKFDKAVRLIRHMDDPTLTDAGRLRIYALRSDAAIEKLAGMAGARGFYHGRASGSVAFVPRRSGNGGQFDLDTDSIFFHEYTHHLQLQYSSMALPVWFREGFAEFFATADIKHDGSVVVGEYPAYRVRSLFNENAGLTFQQMLGETYGRLDLEAADRLYAMGWLLTHYLTFEKSRQGQLERYIRAIQNGLSPLDSAKAAFGDLTKLAVELERYKGGRLPDLIVSPDALSIGPIQLRTLTAPEAAMMDVHIRSTNGVNSKTAPGIAADARRIAARYPNDGFVQSALAEAEQDAHNFAAADAAADRALAADPKDVHALIYKGRAQLDIAKRDPQHANWSSIRGWFTKANKIDTEDAEPLALFYETYVAAGQQPTTNAVDALLYAVALAPQDERVRVEAFRELLREKRLPEAKKLFAPIAYQPHASGEWRDLSGKIMAALSIGDENAVLALLDEAESKAKAQATKK